MKYKGHDQANEGRKAANVGPSDSSDSASDRPGEIATDSDSGYTGDRASTGPDPHAELHVEYGADRVVTADEAGLGGGLDQAEEAQLGITDEEIAERFATRSDDI